MLTKLFALYGCVHKVILSKRKCVIHFLSCYLFNTSIRILSFINEQNKSAEIKIAFLKKKIVTKKYNICLKK